MWDSQTEEQFCAALLKECRFYREAFPHLHIKTLFIGGGTPSSLRISSLKRLLEGLFETFNLARQADPLQSRAPINETTIEMNPESVDPKKLQLLRSFGFNRVSLGIQSFHAHELRFLGRKHTQNKIHKAITFLKESGFRNFNLDLIFGIPKSTLEDVRHSLESALSYSPTHISAYALTIEKGTLFYKRKISPVATEMELAQYRFISAFLSQKGYRQYEVSAFSLPGYACQHNLQYWKRWPYIGLGPSAASFFQGRAYQQPSSLKEYIENPLPPLFREHPPKLLSPETELKEFLVANLRLLKGFSIREINRRFQMDFSHDFSDVLAKLYALKWIRRSDKRLQLTRKGLYLLNDVLMEFM